MEIITFNHCPAIPTRNHDWSASREDYDLDDPIGYGATEQEAIEDLKEKEIEA